MLKMDEKEKMFFTFNKVYIVDCQTTLNFEELKQDLINEIKRDTIENKEDETIVKNNMDLLEKVVRADLYQERFIIEELEKFGATVFKVNNLVNGLIDLQNYYKNVESNNANKELKDNINKVLIDMTNYFKEI
jgi:hypothetical protein